MPSCWEGQKNLCNQLNVEVSAAVPVGRLTLKDELFICRLYVHRHNNDSIEINMNEYMQKFLWKEVSKRRRKQFSEAFTVKEVNTV